MYLEELQDSRTIQLYPNFKNIQWKTNLDTY